MEADYKGIHFVSSIMSLICSAVLIATWCFIPQWRTLLNYIVINQIIRSSLHSYVESLPIGEMLESRIISHVYFSLFYASLCWSLCASLISYLKLVLICPGKISCGKWKATIFSYGLVLLMKFVAYCVIPKLFQVDSDFYGHLR